MRSWRSIEAGPQDADCSGASNKKLEEENRGLKDEITALLRYKSTTGDTLLELQTARGTMERELNQLKAELDEKKRNLEEMHQRSVAVRIQFDSCESKFFDFRFCFKQKKFEKFWKI